MANIQVFFLGNLPIIDPIEGSSTGPNENAAALVGSYGNTGSPLSSNVTTVDIPSASAFLLTSDHNPSGLGTSQIQFDIGSGNVSATVDAIQAVTTTVTFSDNSTNNLNLQVFQTTTGDTFLAIPNSLQNLFNNDVTSVSVTSIPSTSIRVLGIASYDAINLTGAGGSNGIVDGEETGEVMGAGYDDSGQATDGGGDIIDGADGPNDIIHGNGGDDTINAGIGTDTVDGGSGNDIIDGGFGVDNLDGGTGVDTVSFQQSFGTSSEFVHVDLQANVAELNGGTSGIETVTNFENVIGSQGNDEIIGTDEANQLEGRDGNDTIDGGAGNDTLDGGLGNDTLAGNAGDDTITGGEGNDTIHGDTIFSQPVPAFVSEVVYQGNGEFDNEYVEVSVLLTEDLSDYTVSFYNVPQGAAVGTSPVLSTNASSFFPSQSEVSLQEILNATGGTLPTNGNPVSVSSGIGGLDLQVSVNPSNPDYLVFTLPAAGATNPFDPTDSHEAVALTNTETGEVIAAIDMGGDNGFGPLSGGVADGATPESIATEDAKITSGGAVSTGTTDTPGSSIIDTNLSGDDTLDGGAGDDTIFGGDGEDIIDGGDDDDTLDGEYDNDTIDGGAGEDFIEGGAGDDTINGGDGNDTIYGEDQNGEYYVGSAYRQSIDFNFITGNAIDPAGIAASTFEINGPGKTIRFTDNDPNLGGGPFR